MESQLFCMASRSNTVIDIAAFSPHLRCTVLGGLMIFTTFIGLTIELPLLFGYYNIDQWLRLNSIDNDLAIRSPTRSSTKPPPALSSGKINLRCSLKKWRTIKTNFSPSEYYMVSLRSIIDSGRSSFNRWLVLRLLLRQS